MERDMFDTMTMTKVIGALCGTFLVFLLGGWAAETIYHVGGGGHGDHHDQAYVIEVKGGDGHSDVAEEVVAEVIDVAAVMAAADAENGSSLFSRRCSACHAVEAGKNGTGPSLYGVVDGAVGSADGFAYSGSLVAVAQTWNAENLFGFLKDPKGYAPGTKMNFKGLSKVNDRADIIAYLDSLDD